MPTPWDGSIWVGLGEGPHAWSARSRRPSVGEPSSWSFPGTPTHAAPDETADQTRRVKNRNLVQRTKALLMCHEAMTEAAAQRWLQRTAIHRRVKLTRVSTAVIERWSSGPGPVELGTITAR